MYFMYAFIQQNYENKKLYLKKMRIKMKATYVASDFSWSATTNYWKRTKSTKYAKKHIVLNLRNLGKSISNRVQ